MESPPTEKADYVAGIRSWESRAPWYRRISAHTGLQGKLVLSFMLLLTLSMASALWLFLNESHVVLDRRDVPDLQRIGRELLRNPDLLAVAFYASDGDMIALATQHPDFDAARKELGGNPREQTGELLVTHTRRSGRLGSYTQITAPV